VLEDNPKVNFNRPSLDGAFKAPFFLLTRLLQLTPGVKCRGDGARLTSLGPRDNSPESGVVETGEAFQFHYCWPAEMTTRSAVTRSGRASPGAAAATIPRSRRRQCQRGNFDPDR
jgi:hypothetical protein